MAPLSCFLLSFLPSSKQVFLKGDDASEFPGDLVKCRFWFNGAKAGLGACIFIKLPGSAGAAGPQMAL